MKELLLSEEDKKKKSLPIHRGDTVKIIRERETDGLLGEKVVVLDVGPDFVDTLPLGRVVRFHREDVILEPKTGKDNKRQ